MKKYLLMLIVPFMILASCMKDESAYLPQSKEDVAVDNVTPDEGGEGEKEPEDGTIAPGVHLVKLMVNGEERRFKYYMPVSIDPSKPISLIFEFHGSYSIDTLQGITPDPIEKIVTTTAICQTASKENCVVVFPAGASNGTSVDWSKDGYADGLPFFDAMLDFFKRSTPRIDPTRVYSTGHSSGAIFSCVLAFNRSEVLAAIAPRAGRMNIESETSYPSRAVPVRMFLGVDDDKVHHDSTISNMTLWAEKIAGYFPVYMVKSTEPIEVEKYNKKVFTRKFAGAKAPIEIYSIEEEGHNVSLGYMMPYIWEFFKDKVIDLGHQPLFVSSSYEKIDAEEGDEFTMNVNYSDNAEFSYTGVEDWDIQLDGKTMTIKAPDDFYTNVADGVIKLTVKRGGETVTRDIIVNLRTKKNYYSIGEVHYNNGKAVGVIFWVNPKNKREAKVLNLQEVTTQGTYETINYGNFGATFVTPDTDNGEENTAISVQENTDKNLKLTSSSSGLIWAATYTYQGVSEWYLPAINELSAIAVQIKSLNEVIKSVGGRTIEPANAVNGGYLSSTVKPSGATKEFYFYNFYSKTITTQVAANTAFYRARAIKLITMQ